MGNLGDVGLETALEGNKAQYLRLGIAPSKEVELWEEDDPAPHPDDIDELPDMSGMDDAEIYSSLTGDSSSHFEDTFSSFGGDYSAAEGLGGDEIDWESMDYE